MSTNSNSSDPVISAEKALGEDAYGAFFSNDPTARAIPLPAFATEGRPAWGLAIKRFMDISLSAPGLLLLLPFFGLIALIILILDGRPILFKLDEIGKEGRLFQMYKFRTMVVDADAQAATLASRNEMSGPVFKIRNDPRVTRVGAALRRYSLDELPQLLSVLKGDMSLVGPRPLRPKEYAGATPYQRQKLSVTPGITCLWQVMGRNRISDFDAWVALDLKYIREWSILLDLKILIRTIPAVLARMGAW